MWTSPRIIPTKISFTSIDIVISVLSAEDNLRIPLVEREAQLTIVVLIDKIIVGFNLCWLYKYINIYNYNITIMIGLYIHLKIILNVSCIVSRDSNKTEGI